MRRRSGVTLIELVVAMAVFLVVIMMAFGALSNYFVARSANVQLMATQQNFRSAMDRMRYDFAQAKGNSISSPANNTVSNTLSFLGSDGGVITYRCVSGSSPGTYCIVKTTGSGPQEAVTENMHQLVDLYFVRSGAEITVVIVSDTQYMGRDSQTSLASVLVSRNYLIPTGG